MALYSDGQVILKSGNPEEDVKRLQTEISHWKRMQAEGDEYFCTLDIKEFTDMYVIISNVIGYREQYCCEEHPDE
ncbi:hypothetical protein BegalDRAFT_1296 [Beggiatoa alba B18LD]|uniref:Uncharacterized protein n=1 Tax=Beggiatoa alba B18LD TaxID=395493 RepID=I3CEZ9_9GAMM|nr:hypothetical protein [Beggiatoa alba]EIJ42192.1 hypothetical protein BegalDRAFT_1296 [Beggiatoa alba B18LD]